MSAAPTLTALGTVTSAFPVAAIVALAFPAGWLTVNGAVVLTVVLPGSVVVFSRSHLGSCVIGA